MKRFNSFGLLVAGGLMVSALSSCGPKEPIPTDPQVLEETYAGGELGTTFNNTQTAYEDPTPAVINPTPSNTVSISLSVPTPRTTSLSTASDRFTSAAAASPAIRAMVTASA